MFPTKKFKNFLVSKVQLFSVNVLPFVCLLLNPDQNVIRLPTTEFTVWSSKKRISIGKCFYSKILCQSSKIVCLVIRLPTNEFSVFLSSKKRISIVKFFKSRIRCQSSRTVYLHLHPHQNVLSLLAQLLHLVYFCLAKSQVRL